MLTVPKAGLEKRLDVVNKKRLRLNGAYVDNPVKPVLIISSIISGVVALVGMSLCLASLRVLSYCPPTQGSNYTLYGSHCSYYSGRNHCTYWCANSEGQTVDRRWEDDNNIPLRNAGLYTIGAAIGFFLLACAALLCIRWHNKCSQHELDQLNMEAGNIERNLNFFGFANHPRPHVSLRPQPRPLSPYAPAPMFEGMFPIVRQPGPMAPMPL